MLTFFDLIHGEAVGLARSPAVAISYLAVAAILFGCARYAAVAPKPQEAEEVPHGRAVSATPAE